MSETASIIPFGKYRGQSVESVAQSDPQYVDWLGKQDWVRSKCPVLYQVIINNFCQPSETPEHNELQAKFLNVEFRNAVGRIVFARTDWSRESELGWVEEMKTEFSGTDSHHVGIEVRGADVQFVIGIKVFNSLEDEKINAARDARSYGRTEEDVCKIAEEKFRTHPFWMASKCVRVEIKPSVGDDYPSVLRQMQRSSCSVLFVRQYSGVGVDEQTFVKLFRSQGMLVIFEREVVSGGDGSNW